MGAGKFRDRIAFEQRAVTSDGYGGTQGDFAEQFITHAAIIPRFGGEAVMAARLSGHQPVTLVVRRYSLTRQVTTDWRARDVVTGEIYNIRSIVRPPDRLGELDMLTEKGVAT